MALNKYTQAQVEALTDVELDKLAAFLQGWTIGGDCEANNYWINAEGEHTRLYVWWRMGKSYSPSYDRNQSGELLQFAAHKGAAFTINLICSTDAWIYSSVNTLPGQIKISGATARSETIAAVCALLADARISGARVRGAVRRRSTRMADRARERGRQRNNARTPGRTAAMRQKGKEK